MDVAAQLLSVLASMVIIVLCERRINEMQPPVKVLIRASFTLFAVSSLWAIIEIALGEVPSLHSGVLRIGLAALLYEVRGCESSCADLLYHRENVAEAARKSARGGHSLPGIP
ncbi:MAG: hypothetical protein ABTR92_19655 [Candidatus Accumulibacter phosphatis]